MAASPPSEWTTQDADAAALLGWQLAIVWDTTYERLEYEVQALPPNKDEGAKAFVARAVKMGEKLAVKANGLIMASKMGSLRPQKRKKANAKS